jgi:muramidase (phage lysozyme)
MRLNKYKWAALVAALLIPSFLLAATRKNKPHNQALKNLRAFLLMIQYSEGTLGENAYRMLYGGGLFSDFSKHPNIAVTKWGITSTAAGAYGFLYRVWIELSKKLQLPDFSPSSQDKAAIELIRGKGALPDVLNGNIQTAIYKCRKVWASLPGADYGQHERNLSELLQFYLSSGGQLTA